MIEDLIIEKGLVFFKKCSSGCWCRLGETQLGKESCVISCTSAFYGWSLTWNNLRSQAWDHGTKCLNFIHEISEHFESSLDLTLFSSFQWAEDHLWLSVPVPCTPPREGVDPKSQCSYHKEEKLCFLNLS